MDSEAFPKCVHVKSLTLSCANVCVTSSYSGHVPLQQAAKVIGQPTTPKTGQTFWVYYITQMRNTCSTTIFARASDRRLTPRTFAPNNTRLATTHKRYVVLPCHHSHPCPGWHTPSHFAQTAWPATRVALRVVDVLILCPQNNRPIPGGSPLCRSNKSSFFTTHSTSTPQARLSHQANHLHNYKQVVALHRVVRRICGFRCTHVLGCWPWLRPAVEGVTVPDWDKASFQHPDWGQLEIHRVHDGTHHASEHLFGRRWRRGRLHTRWLPCGGMLRGQGW
jgi:hypothetical protein